MPTPNKTQSLYRTLLLRIGGIILAISLIVSLVTMSMLTKREYKALAGKTQIWAKIIAENSHKEIKNNDNHGMHQRLTSLSNVALMNYIHIYTWKKNTSELEIFTSYNRNSSFPAIADRIEKIPALSTPKSNNGYIEYIHPIQEENIVIGYVYLQVSTSALNDYITTMRLMALTIIIITLLLTFISVILLNKSLVRPIKALTKTIQIISKQKSYGARCQPIVYKELDVLAQNINRMLARTEGHIATLNTEAKDTLKSNNDLKNKISLRTDALKESNYELLSTLEKLHEFQGELVESKKMASLGDMVAGIAHEVNTPIGLGITAASSLADGLKRITFSFEEKTLKSSDLKRFFASSQDSLSIILRNLDRTAELISSFKKLAIVQSNQEVTYFNIRERISKVHRGLASKLEKNVITLRLICPSHLIINSKANALDQIISNLISNSITHGFSQSDNGIITITVTNSAEEVNINYCDNGKGVDDIIKDKLFDPFTTTQRGTGAVGLGLHLVYNLVTQALDGTIELNNERKDGVIFDINFPIDIDEC